MEGHVLVNLAAAHPIQSGLQHGLPLRVALDISLPHAHLRVRAVREDRLRQIDEAAMIGRVAQLLLDERDARNVDGLEPCFYFRRSALAYVNRQMRAHNQVLLILGEAAEVSRLVVAIHGEGP